MMTMGVVFAASRIAVISVGTDPVSAGQLQRSVESRLVALPSVELREAVVIASRIGVKQAGVVPAGDDPETRRKLEELLEGARQDTRNGEYDEALERLLLAERLVDPAGTADRVRILLQRSAVLLKREDSEKAAASARAALELQPDLVVDLGVFPPSVSSLVNEVRSTLPIRYTIDCAFVPAVARVLLDGRPVASRFAASPGRHKLSVAAPGFRTLEIPLDVTRNAALDVSPPIALEPALENALFEQAWAPDAASKDRAAARDLAATLDVDGLVLVASRSTPTAEARALVLWREATDGPEISPVKPTSQAGRTALTEWIALRIESGPPKPPVISPRAGRPRSPAVWSLRGGLLVVSRHREVNGAGEPGFSTDFTGVGPRFTAEARKRAWTAQFEVGLQQYDNQEANLPPPGGGSATIQGGTGFRVRVGGGYGFGSDRLRVTPLVGVSVEQLAGRDDDASGKQLGLHPVQTWSMAYGRLEASGVIRERWAISAAFTLAPFGDVREPKFNSTGGDENGGHGDGSGWIAEGGVGWLPIERLLVGAECSRELRSVAWEGQAEAPFNPPLIDARDTQTIDSFQFYARYRF